MRVLILSYAFPPIGGGGVQRVIRFVKYLPQFGWQPYVVCAANDIATQGYDHTLAKGHERDIPVWRVPAWPNLSLVLRLKQILGYSDDPVTKQRGKAALPVLILKRLVLFPLTLAAKPYPDRQAYWSYLSLLASLRTIFKYKIDIILTTSPPFSVHLTGLMLKLITNRPLVVDFRDPWTLSDDYKRTGLLYRFDRWLEKTVLQKADLVICNHEAMKDDFIRMVEPDQTEKFAVLTNGYDPESFCGIPMAKCHPKAETGIVLSYVGKSRNGAAIPLFQAMDVLCRTAPQALRKLRLRFIGGLPELDAMVLADFSWKDYVQVLDPQPHAVAIQEMLDADVLLLLLHNVEQARKWYPGKLFEYLYCRRPIIAIMPSGIATDLVQEAHAGLSYEPTEVTALATILQWIANDFSGFKEVCFKPRTDVINRYDGRQQVSLLSEWLQQVVTTKAESHKNKNS